MARKKKARRGIINLYVPSTHGMERKCNETGDERERKREKKGRSENQFREVDEEEGGLRITRNV